MPESVVINLDSDDDDTLADTASESEDEICLVLKKLCNFNIKLYKDLIALKPTVCRLNFAC